MNIYSYEVDECEILDEEINKPTGKRLTKIKCSVCDKHISEALLYEIREAVAPCRHYDCRAAGIYYVTGDSIRKITSEDRILEATKKVTIHKVTLQPKQIVWYNGKSMITMPCGYAPQCDEETNDVTSIDIAIRRGWLRPYVKPEDKPINKTIAWFKNLVSKK